MAPTIPSSSSICRNSPVVVVMDKWVRRLTITPSPTTSIISSNSSLSSSRTRTRIRVFMTIASRTKGSPEAIISRKASDGWRSISKVKSGDSRDWVRKTQFLDDRSKGVLGEMGSENKEEEEKEEVKLPGLLTLPTILTLGRVAAVPLLVTTFYMNTRWATTITTSIFVAAAATDWLDGYLARKMRQGTTFGAFLDPVADKLMVAATLVLLCTRPLDVGVFGEVPWLLPVPSIAIIGREITMSAVREWAASQDSELLEAVAVNSLGKWKTATQMTALTILLASRDGSLIGSEILVPSGIVLLYISAGLAVWSLVVYMKKIWRVLLK
ncbi:hypothetical protein GIB67_018519 [Kingdonia uniflora]|uniref:Uncharacterized protein n=1 Tax=Kingdonia uniflora TaxID=39325 RepID=A0A7J7LW48_9MAGN|nr:hypothetical protein GIB67_018519 [Kingdonia uniflora]